MITLTINGKKYQCPACYEELSTGTFQRILKEWDPDVEDIAQRDYLKLFAIMTGTDFKAMVSTPENEAAVWGAIHWFVTEPFKFDAEPPKVFEIGGKQITVPKRAGSLSAGQNIILRRHIEKAKFMEECISIAVAICLQPLYDEKKFDYYRAQELEEEVARMPITQTHPVGFFLLQTAREPGRKPTRTWLQILSSPAQTLKGMLPSWLRLAGLKDSMTSL